MSLTTVQTALKNADENPELYSPTLPLTKETLNKGQRLTHAAKEKLDAYFRKEKPESVISKKIRVEYDSVPSSDYEQPDFDLTVNKRFTLGARQDILEQGPKDSEPCNRQIREPRRGCSSLRKMTVPNSPASNDSQNMPPLDHTHRPNPRGLYDSNSTTRSAEDIPLPLTVESISPPDSGRERPRPPISYQRPGALQESLEADRAAQARVEAQLRWEMERAAEEQLEREIIDTPLDYQPVFWNHEPLVLPTPAESNLETQAQTEEAEETGRYQTLWSSDPPHDPSRTEQQRLQESGEVEKPLSAVPEHGEASGASLWNDATSTNTSLSVQPIEELGNTPEPARGIQQPTVVLPNPGSAAREEGIAMHGLSDNELFQGEYPTPAEARLLFSGQRHARVAACAESNRFINDPFLTEEDFMKIPCSKIWEDIHARQEYVRQRPEIILRPLPKRVPQELQPRPEPDSDTDYSTDHEEPDNSIYGILPHPEGQGDLRKWMQDKGYAKPADLHLHPYKGYNIEAPKLQLIRAKNFLQKHNATNLQEWEQRFDELCQYVKHLHDNFKGEDWGFDLAEVIDLLQTHRIWQNYVYSKPKLSLDLGGGKGKIFPGPTRFEYDENSVVHFKKGYRPPGAPRFAHERGSLAGKAPGLFIQPHCVKPPGVSTKSSSQDRPIDRAEAMYNDTPQKKPSESPGQDPFAYTKGMMWFNEQQKKCVEFTKEHAIKEAWGHKFWNQREDPIMPLPPIANWNGPIPNITIDKEMWKMAEKMKKLQTLLSKLRRTADKTAVYGKREVLDGCLDGIMRGLRGNTWSIFHGTYPPGSGIKIPHPLALRIPNAPYKMQATGPPTLKPEDAARKEQEELPIRFGEFEWLEFLTRTAPLHMDPIMMDNGTAIFLDRLGKLLDNPRGDGVFVKNVRKLVSLPLTQRRTPMAELTEAINFGLKKGDVQMGPKTVYVFDEEEVWDCVGVAEALGMIHRVEEQDDYGETIRSVGELTTNNVLPEDRIRWFDVPQKPPQQNGVSSPQEIEDQDVDDDAASAASTISTQLSIPSSEYEGVEYMCYLPNYDSLLPRTLSANAEQQSESDKAKTLSFYQHLGARLGLEVHNLRKELLAKEKAIRMSDIWPDQKADSKVINNPRFLRETLNLWADDYYKRTFRKSATKDGEQTRQIPLYKDICKVIDPEAWSQDSDWDKRDRWDDSEEFAAREAVRQALIRETHESKSNIYPAVPNNISPNDLGNKFPSWRREPLWAFGNAKVRGFKARKFFDMNRWPVHLQDEKTQEHIKKSGPPLLVVEEEKEVEDIAIPYAPTRFPGEGDDRVIWEEGSEYWWGATPKQKREISRRVHGCHEPVPTWKDKFTSLFGTKRKRDEQDEIDAFETGSLRLPSPKHLPKVIENRAVTERRAAKKARLHG